MASDLHRALGRTGVETSRLGLGGHTYMSEYGGMSVAKRGELLEIVELAVAEGINLFDVTYDEERQTLSSLLSELGLWEKVFVTCWMERTKTLSSAELTAEAERALSLLGRERIDLLP